MAGKPDVDLNTNDEIMEYCFVEVSLLEWGDLFDGDTGAYTDLSGAFIIMKKLSYLFIVLAGILWGSMGIFVRRFNARGLESMDIVFLRAVVTFIVMFVILFVYDRKLFVIRRKDLWCFLGTGVASITFFNFCYFNAMKAGSLSMAAILLYTAPAFVMLLSFILFHERLSVIKIISLVITFAGCCLVTGVLESSHTPQIVGILYGIGAGLGYALYSIFSRYALQRGYNSLTITFYTFLITAISTFFCVDVGNVITISFSDWNSAVFSVAFGVLCTVAPFLLYTLGLVHVENSKASILASVEPVFASVIGAFVFKEKIEISGLIGIIMVIAAIVMCALNQDGKERKT